MGVPDAEDRESGSDEGNHDPRTITASVELPGGAITRGFGVDEETSTVTYAVHATSFAFDMGARAGAARLSNETVAPFGSGIGRRVHACLWRPIAKSDAVCPLKTNDGARPKTGRLLLDAALASVAI